MTMSLPRCLGSDFFDVPNFIEKGSPLILESLDEFVYLLPQFFHGTGIVNAHISLGAQCWNANFRRFLFLEAELVQVLAGVIGLFLALEEALVADIFRRRDIDNFGA